MKLYTNYVSMIFFRSTPWTRLLACLVVLITSYQIAAQDGQVKCELFYKCLLQYITIVEVMTLVFS